jgi:hypothetical protein
LSFEQKQIPFEKKSEKLLEMISKTLQFEGKLWILE